jgi:hypothetical protein
MAVPAYQAPCRAQRLRLAQREAHEVNANPSRPQQQAMPAGRSSAPVIDQGKDEDYYDVTRLRRQWNDWASSKDAEGREMVESRHYYHGDQWTEVEIAALRRRKQPVVTSNRIVRKIDAVVGWWSGCGKIPRPMQGRRSMTKVPSSRRLRCGLYSTTTTGNLSLAALRGLAASMASGIEYDLVPGDEGDPSRSKCTSPMGTGSSTTRARVDEGFTDARFLGIAKWVDLEQAKEMFPEARPTRSIDLMESGADQTAVVETDRSRNWINTNEKKVRLADHWYIKGGKWRWCMYIGTVMLMQGVSPFIDEKGKTFRGIGCSRPRLTLTAIATAFVRNLKSPQDEVNHRRSKALHLLNTRRVVSEKGAVDDIEVARRMGAA